MHTLIVIFIMVISILGPAIVIGVLGLGATRSLGRNPSSAPKIVKAIVIALIFAEAVAIVGLLILLQLFG